MAILAQSVYDDEEEKIGEDKKKQVSSFVGEGGVAAGEGVGVGEADQPGGFTGIDKYLKENVPETQEMVEDVQARAQQEQQQFQKSLGEAEQKFGQEVQAGGVSLDQPLVEEFEKTPFQAMQDKEKLARFKAMRDAAYKGPRALSERQELYQPLARQQEQLRQRAEQLQKDPGGLIQAQRQRPLTAGQAALNRALVAGTPEAMQSLREQAEQTRQIASGLEDRRKALRELAQQRAEETEATRKRIGTGLEQARTGIREGIDERIKQLREQATTTQREFGEALQRAPGEELDAGEQAALQAANVSPEEFQRMQELGSYIRDPYRDIQYKTVDINPIYQAESGSYYGGLSGQDIEGRIRYVDGQPVLDDVPAWARAAVLKQLEQAPLETYRQEVAGREFDPSLMFRMERPETAYTRETATTQQEYENLKALRELQQLGTPIGYELQETPELFGVVPQISGETTLAEILDARDREREMYEAQALEKFKEENPLRARILSLRRKQRKSGGHKKRPSGYGTWAGKDTPGALARSGRMKGQSGR